MRETLICAVVAMFVASPTMVSAVPISSLVGDKDGFGLFGAPAVPADETLWRDGAVNILAHRLFVFRLKFGCFDHLFIAGDAGRGALARVPADTGTFGGRPEALHAVMESVCVGGARRRQQER